MAATDPQVRISTLEAALRAASRELHWANLTIQKRDAEMQLLQERLRKQRIGFLGPSSETLSDLQLELLTEEEPSATYEEVEAESQREPILTAPPDRAPETAPALTVRAAAGDRRAERDRPQRRAIDVSAIITRALTAAGLIKSSDAT